VVQLDQGEGLDDVWMILYGTLMLCNACITLPRICNYSTTCCEPTGTTLHLSLNGSTDNADTCRQGVGTWRNLRDLAKERREGFIAVANKRADADDEPDTASAEAYLTSFTSVSHSTQNELSASDTIHEESETSMDELAMPTPRKKRTRARQFKSNKRTGKISEFFVDDEDDE